MRTRATARRVQAAKAEQHDNESDYGSDLDEAAIAELITAAEESQPLSRSTLQLEGIEEYNHLPHAARLPTSGSASSPAQQRPPIQQYVDDEGIPFDVFAHDGPIREPSVEVEYDARNRVAFAPRTSPQPDRHRERLHSASAQPETDAEVLDTRAPLLRFRTAPKKPMSVTDLVSPAWCELQYWYSLTKYGKVRKTPAMRQGSSVHKVLEEQVHTAVPVDVVSREDGFGLRLWNIIQGLRTLRVTGMTRELEVWGLVEGQVVIGVIDELSYTCPDAELEAKLMEKRESSSGKDKKKEKPLPSNQTTMDAFFSNGTAVAAPRSDSPSPWLGTPHAPTKKIYLTDIKTRGSRTVPNSEVSLRPTSMQLMLYHRLLTSIASNSVPANQVFVRYGVDPSAPFSDTFIAQIGGLDFNFHDGASDTDIETAAPFGSSQDSVDELLAHNSLDKLWALMIAEFVRTMPFPPAASAPGTHNTTQASPLGDVLSAEFRASGTGEIIGTKSFAFDGAALDTYVAQEMSWWRGERPARGVDIEEAFKCRICEFADKCTWRSEKVEEGVRKARLRKEERRRSEV